MIEIKVNASRQYKVIMKRGVLQSAGSLIADAVGSDKKICLVTDSTVDKLYGQSDQPLWQSLEAAGFEIYKYVFPGGEAHKTMSTVEGILEHLASNGFTRSDVLVALGGGITGDITGFAAATFLRGIQFIQIPTSLLAIVDSSVGGKTGVNLSSGKNLAGAFWQPSLVLFDPDVLSTLSDEIKLDGIAETIKAGFIADPSIIDKIADCNVSDDMMLTMLASMAVEVKRSIVEEDENESGKRQLLNLGHTAAHAIEKCSNYEISHGHAVAIGMAIVSSAALKLGWCDDICYRSMISALNHFKFPLACRYTPEELACAALHDKKRRGNTITLVIPTTIGNCQLKKLPVEELVEFFRLGLERK